MAVSEAVGTVLLLGISVMLAGGIALWTAQIDEGEEGLYVDLWAYVQGDNLVINHRGGDLLEGDQTYITIRDDSGSEKLRNTYTALSSPTDERWDPGEELEIDLTGVSDNFDLVVTTVKKSGTPTVVLSNSLVKTSSASGLPDLAITRLTIMNSDTTPVTRMNDDGTYLIEIRVDNFGSDMTTPYFAEETDNTVSNIRLFDQLDELEFSAVEFKHFDENDAEIDEVTQPDIFGILKNGHNVEITFTWNRPPSNPRTLGMHTLNAKVVPFFQGEQNYRNNYVERDFKVDKLVKPLPIFGPDPGIYDVSFSNEAPNSGDEVIVTVIIQNSGDQAFPRYNETTKEWEHIVNLVVSTWKPEIHSTVSGVSYNWRVDNGTWIDKAQVDIADDDTFPTCVKTNITLLPGAYFFLYFTLEARVNVPGGLQWVYAAIDVYSPGHLEGIAIENGDDTGDNFGLGSIQVLPKIMLVDDDEVAMNTEGDMTSAVLEALVGSGVNVDKVYVAQEVEDNGTMRDAPAYSYAQDEIAAPAMEDYDIVIWVTGEVTDPFSNQIEDLDGSGNDDQYNGTIQEMIKYLDENKYLMIIGSSPFEGLMTHFDDTRVDPGGGHFDPGIEEAQAASDFLYVYLGILNLYSNEDLPDVDPYLLGMDTGGLTPEPSGGGDYTITLKDIEADNNMMQLYEPRTIDVTLQGSEIPTGMLTTEDLSTGDPILYNTIRCQGVPDVSRTDAQYKTVVIGWDVNQIKYLNEKINLIAEILQWFDWKINVGRDMAITKMQLSILSEVPDGMGGTTWEKSPIGEDNLPKYLDTILIEATVRNNGPAVESTSVIFYVTGPDGIELPVSTGIPDPREEDGDTEDYDNPQDVGSIEGQGGEITVYKLWLAVGVGTYTFRVVVDPYHLVSEISENNNDITYSTSTVTSFVTQNNILVVDDDSSLDNFADDATTQAHLDPRLIDYSTSGGEPSEIVSEVLTNLGYDHEVFTVEQSFDNIVWTYDSGLGILDLKRYNSILWITGDAGGRTLVTDRETLTNLDMEAIMKYLDGKYDEADYLPQDHHENVMFLGDGFLRDLAAHKDEEIDSITVSDFMEQYIGADSDGTYSQEQSQVIFGQEEGEYTEDIYVGLEYRPGHFTDTFDFTSIPIPSSQPDYQDTRSGLLTYGIGDKTWHTVGIQNELDDIVNERYFRTITHTWQSRFAEYDNVETSLHEILYLSLHWFNTPEDQPEILSRNSKIILSDSNPVLGNSYLVEIQVVNLGGVPGGGTIRFMDGGTLVKSENIYLDPDVSTTLEAIWTPLYAGNRTLQVIIDLYDDYDEVFDVINNIPYQNKEVFFFWDDLENGDANWFHDSTEVMINGEGKLDFMEEPTNLNIDNEWDVMDGFHNNYEVSNPAVSSIAKSEPNSFMMHEPSGASVKSVDVALVIDSSGSMGENHNDNDPDNVRKSAARDFIDNMYDEDRVTVYDFDNNVDQLIPFTTDKTAAKSEIGKIDSDGSTALYQAGATALNYVSSNGRDEDEAIKAVVILTDGYNTAGSYNLNQYLDVRNQYDDNPSTEDRIYVFTIRLVDGDEGVLRNMCTQPWEEGPYYFFANDASDLNKIYDTIRTIIQDLAQASTRGSSLTRGTATEVFSDEFPYADRTAMEGSGNWAWISGDPEPVNKHSNSTPYCIEFERDDILESKAFDLSKTRDAFVQFYWRGAYDEGGEGKLEFNEYFYMDIYVEGGSWVTDYYVINNDCFSTPWTRERIRLPDEAMWSGFRVRFRAVTSTTDSRYDAYYLDDFKVFTGTFGPGSIGRQDLNIWDDDVGEKRNKSLETNVIDLTNSDQAELSFFHKYNLKRGANGGVLMIGVSSSPTGPFEFEYIQPDQPYTGNTLITAWEDLLDDKGNPIRWCWNGLSGGGTLDWDYVTVNLSKYSGDYIKIRFQYLYLFGGTGFGWFIDDLKLTITSMTEGDAKFETTDNWFLIDEEDAKNYDIGGNSHAWSGSHSWYYGDPIYNGGDFKDGIDSSIYTRQIDLTNARTAFFTGYFKFNLDRGSGRPPDGFRIEISTDNGNSWVTLSLGVRAAWGVSGSGDDIADGVLDKKTYTGLEADDYWTSSSTLTRLITDLNGFTGNVIVMRFRIVTNDQTSHDDKTHTFAGPAEEFKGFLMDDIVVYGESLEGTRSSSSSSDAVKEYLDLVARHEMERGPPEKGASIELPKRASIDDEPVTGEETSDLTTGEELSTPVAVIAGGVLIAIPLVAVKVNRKYKRRHNQ